MDKIQTVEDFLRVVGKGVGYLVITDKPTLLNRVHRDTCPYITITNFTKKVIKNRSENGSYLYTTSLRQAIEEAEAKLCSICQP